MDSRLQKRVLVYADVNLGIIDGSSSWLISVANVFALAGAHVDVLAREVPARDIVLRELLRVKGVTVIYPENGALSKDKAAAAECKKLHSLNNYDMIVTRSLGVSTKLGDDYSTRHVLWPYIIAYPNLIDVIENHGNDSEKQWGSIIRKSAGLFVQTRALRDYFVSVFPSSARKVHILEPMVPDAFFSIEPDTSHGKRDLRKLTLGYAGKFDKPWRTLEIPSLVAGLQQQGIDAQLVMCGDKVQKAKDEPSWHLKMQELIDSPPSGVSFPGALPRSEIATFMSTVDVGICWRSHELDHSFEISTKLLEFISSGVPVLCNRTAIHEELLGKDYPLFVDGRAGNPVAVLGDYVTSYDEKEELSSYVRSIAAHFSYTQAATRIKSILDSLTTTIKKTAGFSDSEPLKIHVVTSGADSLLVPSTIDGLADIEVTRSYSHQWKKKDFLRANAETGKYNLLMMQWSAASFKLLKALRAEKNIKVALWIDDLYEKPDLGYASAFNLANVSFIVCTSRTAKFNREDFCNVPVLLLPPNVVTFSEGFEAEGVTGKHPRVVFVMPDFQTSLFEKIKSTFLRQENITYFRNGIDFVLFGAEYRESSRNLRDLRLLCRNYSPTPDIRVRTVCSDDYSWVNDRDFFVGLTPKSGNMLLDYGIPNPKEQICEIAGTGTIVKPAVQSVELLSDSVPSRIVNEWKKFYLELFRRCDWQ